MVNSSGVTVVDFLSPYRISSESVSDPNTAAAETQEQKTDKYTDFIIIRFLFQPLFFEILGAVARSTKIILSSQLCKNLAFLLGNPGQTV